MTTEKKVCMVMGCKEKAKYNHVFLCVRHYKSVLKLNPIRECCHCGSEEKVRKIKKGVAKTDGFDVPLKEADCCEECVQGGREIIQ